MDISSNLTGNRAGTGRIRQHFIRSEWGVKDFPETNAPLSPMRVGGKEFLAFSFAVCGLNRGAAIRARLATLPSCIPCG